MDNESKIYEMRNESKIRQKPNIFSRIFLWWMCPVLINGNKREVEEDDLVFPGKKYNADKVGGYLEGYWLEEYRNAKQENREPKLWKAMLRAYWLSYIPGVLYIIGSSIVNVTQPMVFARLLSYWSAEATTSKMDAMYYALAILGLNFLYMMCEQHNSLFLERFGMRVKIAVTSLMYRKNDSVDISVAGSSQVSESANENKPPEDAEKKIWNSWTPTALKTKVSNTLSVDKRNTPSTWLHRRRPKTSLQEKFLQSKLELLEIMKKNAEIEGKIKEEQLKQEKIKTAKLEAESRS